MVFDAKKKIYRKIAVVTLLCFIGEIVFPTIAYAQSGPTQVESSGYTHVSAGENVDNFTGDFTYSLPIMNIEGYPLVMSYNSNVGMTQDASWVGLGWSLNPGSIARQMRGLPDEFNGEDKISRQFTRKPAITVGRKGGTDISGGIAWKNVINFSAGSGFSFLVGDYYNNYKGFGRTVDYSSFGSIGAGVGFDLGGIDLGIGVSTGFGIGFSLDSQNGIGYNHSHSFGVNGSATIISAGYSGTLATGAHTREGRKSDMYYSTVTLGTIGASMSNTNGRVRKTFGTQTYVPRVNYNTFGSGFTRRRGGGVYASMSLVNVTLNGVKENYNSFLSFIENDRQIPAYGYNNLELAENDLEGLMDFNREKERVFSRHMSSLPFSNITYDLYQINTPGISSMFRPYRNDVGTLSDPDMKGESINASLSTSKSFGAFYKSVKSTGTGGGLSTSGEWKNEDGSPDLLAFTNQVLETRGAEKFYFKEIGEKTPFNEELYNKYGQIAAMKMGIALDSEEKKMNTLDFLTGKNPSGPDLILLPTENFKTEREIRSTAINYYYNHELTFLEQGEIRDYEEYVDGSDGIRSYDVVDDEYRKEHHIGKMEVTAESGMIYGYGIPAYNLSDSEVSFNIEPSISEIDETNGLVNYDLTDNTLSNDKGRDHYYDKTTTPSYAYSHLITDIRSSDYADRTNNGFTPDDMGTYIKFNYSRIYGNDNPYKWRFPVSEKAPSEPGYPQANFNEGFQTDNLDDKGFYSYGEKEMWYPQSIENKNFILEFYVENRDDAYPVKGENGELDISRPSKLLRKVVLYTREDRQKNGINATPIKTVEFEYDYSSCKNTPSNKNTLSGDYANSGKLTLKAVRFYSGNSKIGYQSPYLFTYEDQNPDFNYLATDRWGNYKANDASKDNKYFSYSEQDLIVAGNNIRSWKLKRVTYPTGGGIEVNYEADTYANIQDKNVMRHYMLLGTSPLSDLIFKRYNAPSDNFLAGGLSVTGEFRSASKKKKPNNVVYFKLDNPISAASRDDADELLKEQYFTDQDDKLINEFYYRTKVKIQQLDSKEEFIPGFAQIKDRVKRTDKEYKMEESEIDDYSDDAFYSIDGIGVVGGMTGDYHYGYIIIENEGIRDKIEGNSGDFSTDKGYPVQSMQKNAWNFVRMNIPWHIYATCEGVSGDPSIDDCDYSIMTDWKTIFTGKINKVLNNNDYCRTFNSALSTIRLMDSRHYKYGGNGRVASITHFDAWDEISSEPESSYTLEYSYLNDATDITSGVAAYEPINGGDENIFFQPIYFNIDNVLKPDERHYQINPIGESIFPAPIVGYSQVTVKFSDRTDLTRNATGSTKFKYHTAQDYPIKVHRGGLLPLEYPMEQEGALSYQMFGVTQGFSVELNDMHGKIKEIQVIDANSQEVSKTRYNYYAFEDKQKVIDKNGVIEEHWIGKEFDVYADKKYAETFTNNYNTTETIEIKIGIPNISRDNFAMEVLQGFYAVTFQKVMHHSGVLKSVETNYLGQQSYSEILAYDKYTGQPIVQTSKNGFDQNDYGISYPSYWRYGELGSRFENQRLAIESLSINGLGELIGLSEVDKFFCRGDQLLVDNGSEELLAYVLSINVAGNKVKLIDEEGVPFTLMPDVSVLNLNSGFKNRTIERMASFFTKQNPVDGYSNLTINSADVINASALEYIEIKVRVCEDAFLCSAQENPNLLCADPIEPVNPFNYGHIGNWHPNKSYAFQGERINGDSEDLTNLKNDGRIDNFIPFYAFAGGKLNKITEPSHPNYIDPTNYQNWRLLSEGTRYDHFGKTVESQSQIGVYSSVLYGFNNNFKLVPIAEATNAKVSQIAYDGFEDYRYLQDDVACRATGHFDFRESAPLWAISKREKHTGYYSLKINPGQSYEVVRKIAICEAGVECNCEPKFSPDPGKYIIGLWVKEENAPQKLTYDDAKVSIVVVDEDGDPVSTPEVFEPTGNIVEGWQRVEGVFEIPPTGLDQDYCIKVELSNTGTKRIYYDDLRIHPFVSSMSTMAYDSDLLLPMASLDAYNFATYFMYDENLKQVRIRQETERGIYTIVESSGGIKK